MLAIAIATGQAVEQIRLSKQPAAVQAAQVGSSGAGLPEVRGITSVAASQDGTGQSGCAVAIGLTAAPSAMIDVALTAPCNRGERVVIRYSGLSFTTVTGAEGVLRLQLPALEAATMVAAYFEGSEVALSRIDIPDVAAHPRLAVAMAHPARFDLRALEGDRLYVGTPAHRSGEGPARIHTLGISAVADPIITQVYSFPSQDVTASNLSVELRITPDTCGRTLPMTSLLAHNGRLSKAEQSVPVPLCGTAGDILVLKNLLRDLTLAAPM